MTGQPHTLTAAEGEEPGNVDAVPLRQAVRDAGYTLSRIYDADARVRDPKVAAIAARMPVPHPLRGVTYADGTLPKPALLRIADPYPDR